MLNVNEYFEGGVKSIGFQGPDLASSVGVMAPTSAPTSRPRQKEDSRDDFLF